MQEIDRKKTDTRVWLQILALEQTVFSALNGVLMAEFGLSVAKFEFLAQVDRYEDGVSLGEISNNLKVTSGNVSGLVKRLLDDGLISKTMSASDRRSFIVQFTPKGREVFEAANQQHGLTLAHCFAGVSDDELTALLADLRRFSSQVQGQVHAK